MFAFCCNCCLIIIIYFYIFLCVWMLFPESLSHPLSPLTQLYRLHILVSNWLPEDVCNCCPMVLFTFVSLSFLSLSLPTHLFFSLSLLLSYFSLFLCLILALSLRLFLSLSLSPLFSPMISPSVSLCYSLPFSVSLSHNQKNRLHILGSNWP